MAYRMLCLCQIDILHICPLVGRTQTKIVGHATAFRS